MASISRNKPKPTNPLYGKIKMSVPKELFMYESLQKENEKALKRLARMGF
jgi:hypothetical protein